MNWLRGFLSNDSLFGRLMGRCGALIVSNVLFLIFSVPLVTIGASWTALYGTMMRALREDWELDPVRTFWRAFREDFKQATAAWILMAALALFLGLEIFWCGQFDGPVALFRYPLTALLLIEAVIGIYLFPTMAAFRATLPELVQDSIWFAVRRPVTLVLLAVLHIMPPVLTYMDLRRLPLWAFLWCTVGASTVAMCGARMLLRQFAPLLGSVETEEAPPERSEREILDEMEKLGM